LDISAQNNDRALKHAKDVPNSGTAVLTLVSIETKSHLRC